MKELNDERLAPLFHPEGASPHRPQHPVAIWAIIAVVAVVVAVVFLLVAAFVWLADLYDG